MTSYMECWQIINIIQLIMTDARYFCEQCKTDMPAAGEKMHTKRCSRINGGDTATDTEVKEEVKDTRDPKQIALMPFQEAYITACTQINIRKEPTEQIEKLVQFCRQAYDNNQSANDMFFRKFLYEDLVPQMMKRLEKEFSCNAVYLDPIAQLFEEFIKHFYVELKAGRFHKGFIGGMVYLFKQDSYIFGQSHYRFDAETIQKLSTVSQTWRADIKVGDMLDVYVKADDKEISKLQGWMQGKVVDVEGDQLDIIFPESPPSYDKEFNRYAAEIAQFESKTLEDYAWRRAALKEGLECDAHDKCSWQKATLMGHEVHTVPDNDKHQGRKFELFNVAFRVYREVNSGVIKKDEQGRTFEGWSSKQDEKVPFFCPRIMPWATKVGKYGVSNDTVEEDLDEHVKPEAGHSKVYAVPRPPRLCMSSVYIHLMNVFGNLGGFDLILDLIKTAPIVEQSKFVEELDVQSIGALAQCLTMPNIVFHKNFIAEHGETIIQSIRTRITSATDKSLKDVPTQEMESLLKNVDNFQKRWKSQEQRDQWTELLKLELCVKALSSEFVVRRINGMKDLKQIIENNTLYSTSKTFSAEYLTNWMTENGVFETIWDAKKTHVQLVNRSGDVFKMLAKNNFLTPYLLKKIWDLAKTDYKQEVLKFIGDGCIHLSETTAQFFINNIALQDKSTLHNCDFTCVCEFGKYSSSKQLSQDIFKFFFDCITASNIQEELLNLAVNKCSEMLKQVPLEQKKDTFVNLIKDLGDKNNQSSLAIIKLFDQMINDQKNAVTYTANTTSTYTSAGTNYGAAVYTGGVNANGVTVISYSNTQTLGGNVPAPLTEESIYNVVNADSSGATEEVKDEPEAAKEIDLSGVIALLQSECGLTECLFANLEAYCELVKAKVAANQDVLNENDPKQLFLVSEKYSHYTELDERLKFISLVFSVSDFMITQAQLKVIYDLLSSSPVISDSDYFLEWCRTTCNFQTAAYQSLDLQMVGIFLSEMISNKVLNLARLPIAGFNFVSDYFLSVNESTSKLIKLPKQVKKQSYSTGQWGTQSTVQNNENEIQPVKVLVNPSDLDKIDLIWQIVLYSQDEKVTSKAAQFLIQLHTSMADELKDEAPAILQSVIDKSIALLQEGTPPASLIKQVIGLLFKVIQSSEMNGTNGIMAHNAILNGERLDRIIVRNETRKGHPNVIVRVYTSASVWEFIQEVSYMLDTSPRFVKFTLPDGTDIKESDHGKVLAQLNLKNDDIITAKACNDDEVIPQAPLVENGQLTEAAAKAFNWMFDLYAGKDGLMNNQGCVHFIRGCTGDVVQTDEARVKTIMGNSKNKEAGLARDDFISFFTKATSSGKNTAIFANLRQHNIRSDLIRMRDVEQTNALSKLDMPRYTMSANEKVFSTLLKLLERNDESSEKVWNLIRSLATNVDLFQKVLQVDELRDGEGKIQWQRLLENDSNYRKVYNFEIIEALLEEGECFADNKRVELVTHINHTSQGDMDVIIETRPPTQVAAAEGVKECDFNDKIAKEAWTNAFLKEGGYQYVCNALLNYDLSLIESGDRIQNLKEVSFMMTLTKVFLESQIKSIDLKALSLKIVQIVQSILQGTPDSIEEKMIVDNAMSVWAKCITQQPELFDTFKSLGDQTSKFILSGLLFCPVERVRISFKTALQQLAQTEYIMQFLSANFGLITQYPCRQYFDLFGQIVDAFFASADESNIGTIFNPEVLLGQIVDKIIEDKQAGKAVAGDEGEEDEGAAIVAQQLATEREKLLVGLIELAGKILAKVDSSVSEKLVKDKNLVNVIFKEFLFASVFAFNAAEESVIVQKTHSRKTRSKPVVSVDESRKAAYTMMNVLVSKSATIMNEFIDNQLMPLMEKIKKPKGWSYSPKTESTEASQKYCGINNLGAICYMNSMMQQFFMVPALRYNLMCVDDGKEPNWASTTAGGWNNTETIDVDDNVLHQLQNLICHLELSDRPSFNPKPFCYSFKDLDGGSDPVKTGEQRDSSEFLSKLFERMEIALKETSRKYLFQDIFNGKTASQKICGECGNTKTSVQEFPFLTLDIKECKKVEECLAKLIKGEEIEDYKCDACSKKCTLQARTTLAASPNVLILHLKRIDFSFETFQTVKYNNYIEIPEYIDLKPYSYHHLNKKEAAAEDGAEEADLPNAEGLIDTKAEKDEDQEEPIYDEDCWEYKLVGTNVHSGSANGGHYWSYINTERYNAEGDNDQQWLKNTSQEPWMEFNDARVFDWNFDKLKENTFGDMKEKSGYGGSTYGQSAYMLIYERRKKKPLRVIVPEDQIEQSKAQDNMAIHYNEKTKEHHKLVPYHLGIGTEQPNQIYKKVFEDNATFTFEKDVFSESFYDFIKGILQNVANFAGGNTLLTQVRVGALKTAKKLLFEIISHCTANASMGGIITTMINIFKKDTSLAKDFLLGLIQDDNGELLFECLLSSTDKDTRQHIGRLLRFLLCYLKVEEAELILNDTQEEITQPQGDTIQQPASVVVRVMNHLVSQLNNRVAVAWSRMHEFLEVLYAFGVYSADHACQDKSTVGEIVHDSIDVKVGMHYYFSIGMIQKIGDFMLGKKSPFVAEGEVRIEMGTSYTPAKFDEIMKLFNFLMSQNDLLVKFPLSDSAKAMFEKKQMLIRLLDNETPSPLIKTMCHENMYLTQKLAKNLLKAFSNPTAVDSIQKSLLALNEFLTINDSLKQHRIEWMLGVAQLSTTKRHGEKDYKVVTQTAIGDTVYKYETSLRNSSMSKALLTQLLDSQIGHMMFCIGAISHMMNLFCMDDDVAKYMYNLPPPNLTYARYTDWFIPYLKNQQAEQEKQWGSTEAKKALLGNAMAGIPAFEQKCKELQAARDVNRTTDLESKYKENKSKWMVGVNPDVISHFPPQYIIGDQVADTEVREILKVSDDNVEIRLLESQHEFAYSNPTGFFNLSKPDCPYRKTAGYGGYSEITYEGFKANERTEQIETQDKMAKEAEEAGQEFKKEEIAMNFHETDVRKWDENCMQGYVLLRLEVTNKLATRCHVQANIEFDGASTSGEQNIEIPVTPQNHTLFNGDCRILRFYQKKDPTVEGWPNLKITFMTEQMANNTSYSTGGNYVSSGVGTGTGTWDNDADRKTTSVYVPSGGGVKVACRHNCDAILDFGQDWCQKCGESQAPDEVEGMGEFDYNANYYT